jgi:hypothetical protein
MLARRRAPREDGDMIFFAVAAVVTLVASDLFAGRERRDRI